MTYVGGAGSLLARGARHRITWAPASRPAGVVLGRARRRRRMLRRAARGATAAFAAAALIAVVAVAVGWLRPVVTQGASMRPTYSAGDLVVIGTGGSYELGAIAAYRDPASDAVVLHRIVGGDTGGFEMRGDANASVDPYRPTADDMLGTPVAHLPAVGRVIQTPASLVATLGALAAVAIVGLTLTGGTASRRRATRRASRRLAAMQPRRRFTRRTSPRPGPALAPPPTLAVPVTAVTAGSEHPPPPRRRSIGTVVLAVLVATDIALGVALIGALAMPPEAVDAPPAPLQQASLGYGATVASGVTYPDGVVGTGDTVFRRLVDHVDVVFTYGAADDSPGDSPAGAATPSGGTARLRAEVTASSGWTATIPLDEAEIARGDTVLTGRVELGRVDDLLEQMTAETGVDSNAARVTFVGEAEPMVGSITGEPITATIPFSLSQDALTPAGSLPLTGEGAERSVSVESALLPADTDAPTTVGGVPLEHRRTLLVLLLVSVALTAAAWPISQRARTLPVQALTTSSSLTRIRMNDDEALDEIALYEASPVLEGDGWRAVLADQKLYWHGTRTPDLIDA